MPLNPQLAALNRRPKILLLGSGGLSIGQAGEFDYSGTQAVKALVESNCDVVIINPNIATVQTNPEEHTKVYLYPVEVPWIVKVIEEERPDAIVAGFGGQTALNGLLQLDEQGILEKYNIINLGTPADTLRMTEDRDLFAKKMHEIGKPIPTSKAVSTLEEAVASAHEVGYPVIVRAAYALGGLGSGFAKNDEELAALVQPALATSPQVLIEKSLQGWKEVEYEVMRDGEGNTITICNMENFDPLGIHTGDSIVVAPSQSLSDDEYQILRNASLDIVNALGVVGECNVQLTLDPESLNYYVIEVNARLSRSSALASKASGYPIAYIAAKVVLGHDLLELKNPVTGVTYAFFEPAFDYVTMKVPRWDLKKFRGASRFLGSTMKSVGEVMAIGRTFPEVLQKAVRMVTEQGIGLSGIEGSSDAKVIEEQLQQPTDARLYAVIQGFRNGMDIDGIHALTKIDKWFLLHLRGIVEIEQEILQLETSPEGITKEQWQRWKRSGFGDEQIAYLILGGASAKPSPSKVEAFSLTLREHRERCGVRPVVKKIDTTAAEYPSPSNYLYLSYGGMFDDHIPDDKKEKTAVVLGGGAYRVGTSVEFDWCAVSCSRRLQKAGWRSVIINCNPETVSTDYNSSDRLYFDELTLERILDICHFESATGVVASMGGQLPNRLARPLATAGMTLLGHSPDTIDCAEDRSRFSALLDEMSIDQPRWIAATDRTEMKRFIEKVGFPVLIRPSYVLSGAAMNVAYNEDSLERFLSNAADVSAEHPVVVSEFLLGAREIELDGIARDGEILTAIVSEHIENAGVHSGDATMVVPAQKLYVETVRRVRRCGHQIAKGLRLNGPFNIQFLARSNQVKVIECNVRAARSTPFVSKVVGLNLAEAATDVMIGRTPSLARFNEDDLPHVGVKAAMFSFQRLRGADPVLGVEMASTGEVGCIGKDFEEALLLALEASRVHRPKKGVLVSAGTEKQKIKFLQSAKLLSDLGIPLYATAGTSRFFAKHGVTATAVDWPGESDDDVISLIRKGTVDFVINIPKSDERKELTYGSQIRQAAVEYGCSLITNIEKANAMVESLGSHPDFVAKHQVMSLPPYH